MIMFYKIYLILLFSIVISIHGTHFRGGIITWRALNTTPSGSSVDVLIHQRYSWRRDYWPGSECTDATIASRGNIGFVGTLSCYGIGIWASADTYCTDFSASSMDYSSGERFDTQALSIGGTYVIGFYSTNWLVLSIKGNGPWQVTGKIQLSMRPDGKLNTSPVTSTLPVIYRTVNVQHIHIIPMADADATDTLRCRWATNNTPSNFNNYDECGSVCAPTLPAGYTLFADNCTLVYTLTVTGGYYAVALQIEDYFNSTSPTPMSSVPIQFLFYGIVAPTGCSTPPIITGVRPNLACIGTPIGILTNETVIAQIDCPGKIITEFTTSSPMGLIKSPILNPSTGVFMMTLLFTPNESQYGPQVFCAAAIDNTDVQSDPWCITFLVGFTAPDLQTPILVQGSASPLGTVFANQSVFSIQSQNGAAVNRPGHNGTYVSFHDVNLNDTVVLQYDCGWSPNVIYSSDTIIINAPYSWIPGHHYYVTFDSGASSGNDFCHAESAPITNPAFWQFDIWNPDVSSTITTTTTPPTTHTVTTRPIGTTTPIANLTTTGIVITSTLPPSTTTITTTTTTSVTTTSETTTTVTITISPTDVLSPKDLEDACKLPVAIGTLISMMAMLPINIIGMYAIFLKMDNMFNPHRLQAAQRTRLFKNRVANRT